MMLTAVAIIWLDHGRNLSDGSTAPLATPFSAGPQQWQVRYLPTIQYKPGAALKPRSRRITQRASPDMSPSLAQSSAWLDQDYGRDLDRQLADADPLYALSEVMRFAAASECQFLAMLESKLCHESNHRNMLDNRNFTISNLLYYRRLLDRHVTRLEQNTNSFNHHPLSMLAPDKKSRRKLTLFRQRLRLEYQELLRQASRLQQECSDSMQIAMNVASIRESQKAIKLTKLAFIFLPLTYVTSFFGMNFLELGTGKLSVWIWAVSSLPAILGSILIMQLGLRDRLFALISRRTTLANRQEQTMQQAAEQAKHEV
jgi:CorA-like Mg2+ transporter protein